jgi:hypothetical protein
MTHLVVTVSNVSRSPPGSFPDIIENVIPVKLVELSMGNATEIICLSGNSVEVLTTLFSTYV